MAFERSERGHRPEGHQRRGEAGRERSAQGHDDPEFYGRRETEREANYPPSLDRRHWRGHDDYVDDYADDEFERGRSYHSYDPPRQRPLEARHHERFLRPTEGNDRSSGYGGPGTNDWRRGEAWNDDWSGPYAGRGPKGYRRSDERIQEDVCERLTEHPSIDASDIEVTVSAGDVTLMGRVESRAVKHLTEVMVETVSGVKEVHNQLRIAPRDQHLYPSAPEPVTTKTRRE